MRPARYSGNHQVSNILTEQSGEPHAICQSRTVIAPSWSNHWAASATAALTSGCQPDRLREKSPNAQPAHFTYLQTMELKDANHKRIAYRRLPARSS